MNRNKMGKKREFIKSKKTEIFLPPTFCTYSLIPLSIMCIHFGKKKAKKRKKNKKTAY